MIILQNNGHYISKFVDNYTNLKKICQYCGKPAQIRNNLENPYMIQLICPICKRDKGLCKDKYRMADDIPLINLKENIITDTMKLKAMELTPEISKKIKSLLTSNYTKEQALEYMNMSYTTFNRMLNEYSKNDPEIKDKLKVLFNSNRNKIVTNAKLKSTVNNKVSNNLSKIKYEKNITNKDIIRKSNGRISHSAISMIQNGKTIPTISTKCLLAEMLDVSVSDIFPDDWFYSNIKNYTGYLKLNDKIRIAFADNIEYRKNSGINNAMRITSEETNINLLRLYEFSNNHVNLNHDELIKLIDYLSTFIDDKQLAREFKASFI